VIRIGEREKRRNVKKCSRNDWGTTGDCPMKYI
jgi:hypothetical protein